MTALLLVMGQIHAGNVSCMAMCLGLQGGNTYPLFTVPTHRGSQLDQFSQRPDKRVPSLQPAGI